MSGKYAKLLIFWGALFAVSVVFIFTSLRQPLRVESGGSTGINRPNSAGDPLTEPGEQQLGLSMTLALVTAVASGGGFIFTTIFAIRDDRRQTAIHQLRMASLQKEIEHKDLQIDRLRRERKKELPLR
jgi:hypothetical protein